VQWLLERSQIASGLAPDRWPAVLKNILPSPDSVTVEPVRSPAPEEPAEAPLIGLIEDDASFRTALGRLLRSWGYRVESFESAEAFLRARTGVHCLVVDLHLGGMNGLDFQDRLAEEGLTIPLVFMTAMEDSAARRRALHGGAAAYLQKPLDERQLLEIFSRLIDYVPT
jgi:FixJ family two-component response regulator